MSYSNELSIVIVVAFIIFSSPYIARFCKIPTPPAEIMFGIVAGTLGFLPKSETFSIVADVGFYYLMFLAGMHVNLRIFVTTNIKILKKSLIFLTILYLIAIALILIFELSKIFFIVIPIISVGLLSTLYKEYGISEKWLNLAMLVGCIGEVVSIALLTFGAAYLQSGISMEFVKTVIYFTLFLAVCVLGFKGLEVLFWWFPQLKKILAPQGDKDEKDIRLCMAMFLFSIAIMILLDIEVVMGAFVAGSFIATFFDDRKDLPHKLSSFGFGFLVPIFFIHIGSTVGLKTLFVGGVMSGAFTIMLAMFGAKLIASVVFIRNLGFIGAMLFGLSLSMPLTLLIATATLAFKAGNISHTLYVSLIVASLIEAVVVMIGIKLIKSYKNKLNMSN